MSTVPAARRGVPSIALLGAGMGLIGAAGYAFVAIAGHTLSTSDAAAESSFYLTVNIIGPGLFLAVEQETSRRTSHALATGGPLLPVVRKTGLHAAGLLLAIVALLTLSAPVLISRTFGGNGGLFAATLITATCAAGEYVVRGVLGGQQRFLAYAVTLVGEGLGRLLPVLALAVSGQGTATGYAVVFAVGTGFGALAGLPWLIGPRASTVPAPEVAAPAGTRMGFALGLLAASTLMSHLVANFAPLVVTARLGTQPAIASSFAAAFVLTRVPLFLIGPMQALLTPALTDAAARRDFRALRLRLRAFLALVSAIAAAGALGSALLGPWIVRTFFGARAPLPGSLLGLLAVGTGLLMAAQVLQPALIAFGRHRVLASTWAVSTAVMALLLALPGDPLRAAVIAQLTGPALLVAGMAYALGRQLHRVHVPEYAHVPADT